MITNLLDLFQEYAAPELRDAVPPEFREILSHVFVPDYRAPGRQGAAATKLAPGVARYARPFALGAALGAAMQAYAGADLFAALGGALDDGLKSLGPKGIVKLVEKFTQGVPIGAEIATGEFGAEPPSGGVGTQPEDPMPRPYYVPVSKNGGYAGRDPTFRWCLVDHPSKAIVFETREACAAWCETLVPEELAVEAPFVVYTAQ